VDVSNPTYKGSEEDLTYPSPGCGAGPWDGLPPGHKAQQVDLELARPVLARLGLPNTREGERASETPRSPRSTRSVLGFPSLFPPSAPLQQQTGYECLFGAAYVGSHLGQGAIWRAAQADAEVEMWRYKVRLPLLCMLPLKPVYSHSALAVLTGGPSGGAAL
jgi:hypothetical protein